MSGTHELHDQVGDASVHTSLHSDGDRWMSTVSGGAMDGYTSVMDAAGDIATLHAAVLDDVRGYVAPEPPPADTP